MCGGGVESITWEFFLKHKCDYSSNVIVIGSVIYYEEIKKIILKDNFFSEKQILYIDDWIEKFPLQNWILNEKEVKALPWPIRKEQLIHARLLPCREAALDEMPKGLVVAEIGVAYGDFTEKILSSMKPSKFFAIDIFSEAVKGIWNQKVLEENNMTHQKYYECRFHDIIEDGVLETRKGLSWEQLESFPDCYFDWVYLDAAHDYNSVKKDVSVLTRKLKPGGIIQFNDYIMYDYIAHVPYGVEHVVSELLHNNINSEVLYYCLCPRGGFDDIVIRIN